MYGAMSGVDALWFQSAIIYELHVRAFADSNGDGIGDLVGLCNKLHHRLPIERKAEA